jgi:type IV pilus assembly protein PilE
MKMKTSARLRPRQRGFSLIELMVTVAAVAILAGVATPIYLEQTKKTRRADGFACLMDAAQRQENYFYTNNTYTTTVTNLGRSATCGDDGNYTLSVAAGTTGSIATSYKLTATRAGTQASDKKCGDLTLSSEGVKGNVNASSPASDCW